MKFNIGKDKYKHALAGIIFAVIFTQIGLAPLYVFLLVLLVGISKEVYDYLDYGLFDKQDVIATIIPVLIYYTLLLILNV